MAGGTCGRASAGILALTAIRKSPAEKRWAALSKEERRALPLEEQAAIRAEIQAHNLKRQSKRAAYNIRRAERLTAATIAAETTLRAIQEDAAATCRAFAQWEREAKT